MAAKEDMNEVKRKVLFLMYRVHPNDGWTAMRVTPSRLEARGIDASPGGILMHASRLVVPGARQLELREDLDGEPLMMGYRPWHNPTSFHLLDPQSPPQQGSRQYEGDRMVVKKAR